MRQFSFLIVTIYFLFSFSTYSQNEKLLVDKYRSALGKTINDADIKSIEVVGDFAFQKLKFPVLLQFKSPSLLRVEMTFQTVKFLQISNDSIKWDYNPLEDKSTITRINENQSGLSGQNSTFDFINKDLLEYDSKKFELKLKGKKTVDSVEAFELELKKTKNKTATTFFLNTKTYLIYKIRDEKGYRLFSNYIHQDGFVFPGFAIESTPKQTMEFSFTRLSFNQPIDDGVFIIPEYAFEERSQAKNELKTLFTKGDNAYYKKQFDSAVYYYSDILKKESNNYSALNSRGLSRIELKDYYEAIADFSKAMEINPKGANAVNNRGLAKYYLGDKKGAIVDYSSALLIDSTLLVSYKNRGQIYIETEEYDLAVKDFASAINLDPKDGQSYFKYAVSLAQQERYEDALAAYRQTLENNYETHEVHNYKGVSEYKIADFAAAKESFYRALTLDDGNLQYLENYGRTLYELADYKAADYQFNVYLKLKNDNPEIHNLKGLCKYQEKDYKGAIKDFSKAIELKDNATYFDNRASAKELLKDYKGAIEDYGESIRLYPTDPSVFYKRGLLRIQVSKNTEGCHDLSTANEMKYEPAKEAIKKNCK